MSPTTTPVSYSATAPRPPAAEADADWLTTLDDACLGVGLPVEAEQEIRLAGASYHSEADAERHVLRAFELAPGHPASHIALYRFYFYRNRLAEALAVGLRCLAQAASMNGLPEDWRAVDPKSVNFADYSALPRFYLFTLKGCAYLSLRLGKLAQGEAMLAKLMELDAADRVDGSVLRGVLDRMGRDDED